MIVWTRDIRTPIVVIRPKVTAMKVSPSGCQVWVVVEASSRLGILDVGCLWMARRLGGSAWVFGGWEGRAGVFDGKGRAGECWRLFRGAAFMDV